MQNLALQVIPTIGYAELYPIERQSGEREVLPQNMTEIMSGVCGAVNLKIVAVENGGCYADQEQSPRPVLTES
jgi:hypothetical protein